MSSPQFSFELYPPRSTTDPIAFHDTIDALAAVGPQFISVTYGAGGSSHRSSLDVLRYIKRHTSAEPMAHLTCVSSTHAQANARIREFLDAGIRQFLAVRGDSPVESVAVSPAVSRAGSREGSASAAASGDVASSAELVQLIQRVQAEREPYDERPVPGLPLARRLSHDRDRLTIAVAAFPNGHPASRSWQQDIDALLAKQVAGATLAITQLFFHAADYFAFVERARRGGVTIPIVPGIMPVTSPARLQRMLDLSGEDLPSDLAIRLEIEPTDEGRREVGITHAIEFGQRLLDGGAPALHLYTFNQHAASLAVLEGCGLIPPPHARKHGEARGADATSSRPATPTANAASTTLSKESE